MQSQPSPQWFPWVRNSLALVVAVGVVWAILAGMNGYQLGSPPTGLNAVANCYHVTRVDFVVPMWKAADPSACEQTSSSSETATTSTSSAQCGYLSSSPCGNGQLTPPTPAVTSPPPPASARVCDDPNWRTDGNVSGEMACP